jgi:hypothetical protein
MYKLFDLAQIFQSVTIVATQNQSRIAAKLYRAQTTFASPQ